jgi:hypothetical protein
VRLFEEGGDVWYRILPELFIAPELAEHSTSLVKRLRQKGSIFARRTVSTDEEPKEELE